MSALCRTATTTSRASPTLKFSSTSRRVASTQKTGSPCDRACMAFSALFSKTMAGDSPSACRSSQTVRPNLPKPQTTTKPREAEVTFRTSAAALPSLPSTFSEPLLLRMSTAILSPIFAMSGVMPMESAMAVTRSCDISGESNSSLSARPRTTKANSPPGASSVAACTADAPERLNGGDSAAPATMRPLTVIMPKIIGSSSIQALAMRWRSMEKPTVTKKRPSRSPRKGAMSASTWCRKSVSERRTPP
mmetsp:Transcript_46775/g.138185  ORF Transcript_46775/g.138185 Transcript_46775/m.138185 type:complete len:248 (-) Transcript_46775:1219-1962(-)